MAPSNYRVPHARGGNVVVAKPQAIGSKADPRWATGRNVKMSLPDHKYKVVEVWTLKQRGADGKVEVVATNVGRDTAEHFIRTGSRWGESSSMSGIAFGGLLGGCK